MSSDQDAMIMLCEHVAKTVLGELVLQGDVGIPYFQTVWNGSPNLAQTESALRSAWLGIDGVLDVTALTTFAQNGVLYYNATIKTIYGEASIGV